MSNQLEIKDLVVSVEGEKVLHGVSLKTKPGEIHAIMGPNGSGKSSLALAIAGHPSYKIKSGTVRLMGKDLLSLKPHQRAKLGLFLAFQNPVVIFGVPVVSFLRAAKSKVDNGQNLNISRFYEQLKENGRSLGLGEELLNRSLNDGFSGGEKKKVEVLTLLALSPKLAILDEIDTGLDVDALKTIAGVINKVAKRGTGIILITHYQRILEYVKPDRVHVLKGGKIVASGDASLAQKIEKEGYAKTFN